MSEELNNHKDTKRLFFQSGGLAASMLEGWGIFYMSASRGPLSHNLSMAAGYLEVQIAAI